MHSLLESIVEVTEKSVKAMLYSDIYCYRSDIYNDTIVIVQYNCNFPANCCQIPELLDLYIIKVHSFIS